jgi:hypothetical protein
MLAHSPMAPGDGERRAQDRLVVALRWAGRVGSLLTLGVIGAFATSGGVPSASDLLLLALFPGVLLAGLALAWWRELLGGLVAIGGVLSLYGVFWFGHGRSGGPYFAVLALPALAFVLCGALALRSARA